ncbi:MAG: heme-binding domain-containing protein [Chlorobi bacterium]|nr:heme-binding domain-containing protein [Chlorobiota bacterium]
MTNQSSFQFIPVARASTDSPAKNKPASRKRWWIIGSAAAVLILLQFFGPTLENPAVDPLLANEASLQLPTDARHVLHTACMDCHSHTTEWPWFAHIAPISWIAAHNVDEGREHLNFSRWGSYTPKQQKKLLDEISTVVRHDRMPPTLHKLAHPSARLSTNERFVLYFWARGQMSRVRE